MNEKNIYISSLLKNMYEILEDKYDWIFPVEPDQVDTWLNDGIVNIKRYWSSKRISDVKRTKKKKFHIDSYLLNYVDDVTKIKPGDKHIMEVYLYVICEIDDLV